jgi:hypothetical protein
MTDSDHRSVSRRLKILPYNAVTSVNAAGVPELRTYLAHGESQRPACADGSALPPSSSIAATARSAASMGGGVDCADRAAMPQAQLTRRPSLVEKDLRFCCADNSWLTVAIDVKLPARWPQVAPVG